MVCTPLRSSLTDGRLLTKAEIQGVLAYATAATQLATSQIAAPLAASS